MLQHTPETQALLDAAIAQIPSLPTARKGKDVNGNVSNGLGIRTQNRIAKLLGVDPREARELVRPYYTAVHARRVSLNPAIWAPVTKAPKMTDAEREELRRRADACIARMRSEEE